MVATGALGQGQLPGWMVQEALSMIELCGRFEGQADAQTQPHSEVCFLWLLLCFVFFYGTFPGLHESGWWTEDAPRSPLFFCSF